MLYELILILTDERLPFASGPGVTGEVTVGLQTDLTSQGRHHFTLVSGGTGEERAAELGLDEELSVEDAGRGVERSSGDGLVNVVGSRDGVTKIQGSVSDGGGRYGS